jgi:hypothetical protein
MNPETFKTLPGARFPSALIYASDVYTPIDGQEPVRQPVAKFLDEVSSKYIQRLKSMDG